MRKILYLFILTLVAHLYARGQGVSEVQYWFDYDYSNMQSLAYDGSPYELDVSHLPVGMHTLHMAVVGDSASAMRTQLFAKVPMASERSYTLHLLLNNEPIKDVTYAAFANGVETVVPISELEFNHLPEGLHSLQCWFELDNGEMSAPKTAIFYKTLLEEGKTDGVIECYVDSVKVKEEKIAFASGVANVTKMLELSMTDISFGLHHVTYQVKNANGEVVGIRGYAFFNPAIVKMDDHVCEFYIDDNKADSKKGISTANGYLLDVDVEDLEVGIHRLTCLIKNKEGEVHNVFAYTFYHEQVTLKSLKWWVNDDSEDLSEYNDFGATLPYESTVDLEVDSVPMTTKRFRFAIEGDEAVTYGVNDLNYYFEANNGEMVVGKEPYMELRTRKPIYDVVKMPADTIVNRIAPGSDSILWYTFDAKAGDSLNVKLDADCSLKVFGPDAAEVLIADTAVAPFDSIFAVSVEGTHYIAVHDVANTFDNVTLEFHNLSFVDTVVHRVTFIVDSIEYLVIEGKPGDSIPAIKDPVKEGHTFIGWQGLPETLPRGGCEVEALFKVNTYRVSFMVDGEEYAADSVDYGASITLPGPPVMPHRTFLYWEGVPETMPAKDVIAVAVFEMDSVFVDHQGLIYNLSMDNTSFELSGYTDTVAHEVSVLADVWGYPVTTIRPDALKASPIKSIVLPATIDSVGADAFVASTDLLWIEWNCKVAPQASYFDTPAAHGNMLVYSKLDGTYKGNLIVNGKAATIQLIDARPYRAKHAYSAEKVTYVRNFSKQTKVGAAAGWEGLIIPFDVEEITFSDKLLKPFGTSITSDEIPCWVATMEQGGTFALTDEIKANTPFIMAVPNSDEYDDEYNVSGEVTFAATNVTMTATKEEYGTMQSGFSLLASYEWKESDARIFAMNDENYFVRAGEIWMPGAAFISNLRDVRPFEAYAYKESITSVWSLKIGGSVSTGLDALLMSRNDNEAWYTLQGIRLGNRPKMPGLYIHAGKLEFVKP